MADEGRFHVGHTDTHVWVVDVPIDKFRKLGSVADQNHHTITKIQIGGMVSPRLGLVWAEQIRDQLNQFDIANAAVAKLT